MWLMFVMKLGLMFGLGECDDEVCDMLCDLCVYEVDVLMFG